MNAIKLPVVAYRNASGLWNVRNENNIRIGRDLTEAQANQMCVALNCHDSLVDALESVLDALFTGLIAYNTTPSGEAGMRVAKARAALAKVEDLRKTL